MELKDLGFDKWFLEQKIGLQKADYNIARIVAVDRDCYLIRNEKNEVLAELTGKFIFNSENCRFGNCTHTNEDKCAILLAIKNGDLSEERYQSYLKLMKESEYNKMSFAEKRKKDQKFGRFIKSVKKQMEID